MKPSTENIGLKIRNLRKSCALTQNDLAREAKVSANYICLLETGNRLPSTELVERLASIFDVPKSQFYKDNPVANELNKILKDYDAKQVLKELQKIIKLEAR